MPTGMSEPALYAWQNAEANVFNWLVTQTGDASGTVAFKADMPKALPATASARVWSFELNGTSEADMRPRPFWRFSGAIEGFFSERIDAQRLVGKVLEATPPADGAIDGVVLVRVLSFSVDRALRDLEEDLARGGQDRVWRLEVQLEVVAVNATPEV